VKEKFFLEIEKLIDKKKIEKAQLEISKLGPQFYKNQDYLYLRSRIFYYNKLYYIAIDTLLIALEFDKNDKTYNLIAEIYNILGNQKLSKNFLDPSLRIETTNSLRDELSGIYRKNID